MRLAPTVHGPHDHGFIPMLIATARATGVLAYVGDGSNRWPAVHRLDAATLYRLALEKAAAGQTVHAVGEETIAFQSIADRIGEQLGVPARSLTAQDAAEHFANPFMALVYGTDAPASSSHTQQVLGWTPNHWSLLDDLERGDYSDAA